MSTTLTINGGKVTLDAIERKPGEIRFTLNGHRYAFRGHRSANGTFLLEDGEARLHGTIWPLGKGAVKLQVGDMEAKISPVLGTADTAVQGETPLSPLAPMPGLVRQVLVKKGDKVSEGQPVAVMEAMKLQTTLKAGGDAVVVEVLVKEGDMIAEGAEFVQLKAAA